MEIKVWYSGRIYVRPVARGVVLVDLEGKPHLDDLLDDGYYEAAIFVRDIPVPGEATTVSVSPQG